MRPYGLSANSAAGRMIKISWRPFKKKKNSVPSVYNVDLLWAERDKSDAKRNYARVCGAGALYILLIALELMQYSLNLKLDTYKVFAIRRRA